MRRRAQHTRIVQSIYYIYEFNYFSIWEFTLWLFYKWPTTVSSRTVMVQLSTFGIDFVVRQLNEPLSSHPCRSLWTFFLRFDKTLNIFFFLLDCTLFLKLYMFILMMNALKCFAKTANEFENNKTPDCYRVL